MRTETPDIVVCTPARLVTHLQRKTLVLTESMSHLVIDEADLIFSYVFGPREQKKKKAQATSSHKRKKEKKERKMIKNMEALKE